MREEMTKLQAETDESIIALLSVEQADAYKAFQQKQLEERRRRRGGTDRQ